MSGARVSCPLGGIAPCPDDLCHGTDTTLCGLEYGFDFCEHDYDPDSCSECNGPDEMTDDEWDEIEDEIEASQ